MRAWKQRILYQEAAAGESILGERRRFNQALRRLRAGGEITCMDGVKYEYEDNIGSGACNTIHIVKANPTQIVRIRKPSVSDETCPKPEITYGEVYPDDGFQVCQKDESHIKATVETKLYPLEKKPIAVLHFKKQKFYISDKGSLTKFKNIEKYNNLPTVFGRGDDFYVLYGVIQNIKFPLQNIKSFYFFESGRWDLIMKDEKIIKLPVKDYIYSLENFMLSYSNNQFKKYKIFDYRIKNQLILK